MAGTLTVQNIQGPSSGANANTVILGSGQKLIVPEHVIGFNQASHNTQQTVTSTSYVSIGLSVSYTAKSADSKLLISWSIPIELYDPSSNSEVLGQCSLYKDSAQYGTSYIAISSMENIKRSGMTNSHHLAINAVDTSSHDYAVYAKVNVDQFTVFRYSRVGFITVMEIAQ